MFNSARLKLTAWYLLIIMTVSLSFSTVIYRFLISEVERFSEMQRARFEKRVREELFPGGPPNQPLPQIVIVTPDLVTETKHRLILTLVGVNGFILVIAGGLGYFLAGKTLHPIKVMIDDQHRFITDSSHELRTPLTALKSNLEVSLLDRNLKMTEARQVIKDSIVEVNKLEALSNSLLELARYQKSPQRLHFEKVSLSDVVKKAVNTVQPLAFKKKLKILSEIPRLDLEANPAGLKEVLVILLENAVKYTESRQNIHVSALKKNKSVVMSVCDQGIGIELKDQPRIFDRFFRSDQARTQSDQNGFGLGLSIAKRIIDLHRGSITVKSKPNQGTTFLVTLPLKQKSA